jgi:hypothetical protein
MLVYPPGFSERVFEFGFNSAYADQNRAVAAPHIPMQNEEKALWYDIAFEIKQRGGAIYSIALQHKTCRFVDARLDAVAQRWSSIRDNRSRRSACLSSAAASLPAAFVTIEASRCQK